MKINTNALQPDCFYHIYNRGINGESLFKEPRNYLYFLRQWAKFIDPVADTYAYCLLSNHFHMLIRTKAEDVIPGSFSKAGDPSRIADLPAQGIADLPSPPFRVVFHKLLNFSFLLRSKRHTPTKTIL